MRLAVRTQPDDARSTWHRHAAVRNTDLLLREFESIRCLRDRGVSVLQVPTPPLAVAPRRRAIPLPEPAVQPEELLRTVTQLLGEGRTRKALARVYDAVDAWMNRREFERCDAFLDRVQPGEVSPTMLVGLLTITSSGRKNLERRGDFVRRTRAFLVATDAARADQLLAGLE